MTPVPHKGMPRWGKWLLYLAFYSAAGTLIWSQLPRGAYPTDLTRVGQGRPALVLAYDISSMGGMESMGLLDNVRGEYAGRVEFLVADLGVPDGHNFAQRHGAVSGSVMLYSGGGSHTRTIHPPLTLETLRRALGEAVSGQAR